jgi:hypothetical protein
MNWHWYNTTGAAASISAASGGNYMYWFIDAGHGTPIATTAGNPAASGIPASGDTIYNDSSNPTTTNGIGFNGAPKAFVGVTIAANQVLNLQSNSGGIASLDTTSVFAAGASLYCGYGVSCAAAWAGNLTVVATNNVVLSAGWTVVGSVSVTVSGANSIVVRQPGQTNFSNISFAAAAGTVNVSLITTAILASGTVTLTYTTLGEPGTVGSPVNWLTLNGGTLNRNGSVINVGHVPAVGNVLSSDNVFGVAGTYITPTVAQVAAGVPFGPSGTLTGVFSGDPGGRVIGGG